MGFSPMNSSTRHSPVIHAAWLVALAVVVPGCGSGRPVMEGVVTLDGTPIANGSIRLLPAQGMGQTAGTGIVDGRYRMEASTGPMKVIINSPRESDKKIFDPAPDDTSRMVDTYEEQVPARYNDATEIEVTIVPGRNEFDFALKSGGTAATTGNSLPPAP